MDDAYDDEADGGDDGQEADVEADNEVPVEDPAPEEEPAEEDVEMEQLIPGAPGFPHHPFPGEPGQHGFAHFPDDEEDIPDFPPETDLGEVIDPIPDEHLSYQVVMQQRDALMAQHGIDWLRVNELKGSLALVQQQRQDERARVARAQ